MEFTPLNALVIAFIACICALGVAYAVNRKATICFVRARIDFLCRFWAFAGPRLTDRTFVAAIASNLVVLGLVDLKTADSWQLALWLVANLLFPVWDNLPAEKLAPPRLDPSKLALDPKDTQVLRDMVQEYRSFQASPGH